MLSPHNQVYQDPQTSQVPTHYHPQCVSTQPDVDVDVGAFGGWVVSPGGRNPGVLEAL